MDFNTLTRKYWEKNKDEIDFSYSATHHIIMSLFKGIYDAITSSNFDIIRITYLGVFKPGYYKMLVSCMSNIKRYREGLLGKERFEKLMHPLIKFFCHNHSKISMKKREQLLRVIKFCKQYRNDKIIKNK